MSKSNKRNPDYSKISKRELFRLSTKSSELVTRWTEAVIAMGAELFLIFPQHEIFKGNYFAKNTLILILKRVRQSLEMSLIKKIIIEYKDNSVTEHSPETIEKVIKEYSESLK